MEREPVVSVELLLAPSAERELVSDWDALAAAGLSSAGAHPHPSNRPHVSLAVLTGATDAAEVAAVAATAGAPPPTVRLAGLLLFPHADRAVLARAVIADAALLAFHARLHTALAGLGRPAPHSAPGEWTPHLTLARRLRLADLPAAIAALGDASATVARVAGVRVWDGRERRVLSVR